MAAKEGLAMKRALVALALLTLSGCAQLPSAWTRFDGQPINAPQLQADETACHGDLTKATLAAGRNAPYGNDTFGYQAASIDIYRGCMASKGYLPQQQ
jgi:hypothetical protein